MSDFAVALRVQGHALGALMIREIRTLQGGSAGGSIWGLLEPMILLGVIVLVHVSSKDTATAHSIGLIMLALMTGYVPHLMFRRTALSGASTIRSGRFLLFHRRIHYLDLVVSGLTVDICMMLIATVVVYFIVHALGMVDTPRMMAYVYLGLALHLWFMYAVVFALFGLSQMFAVVRRLSRPISLLTMGPYLVFFMADWLPPPMRNLLLYFPSANAAEIMRYGFLGTTFPTYFDIPYTIAGCMVSTFVGVLLARAARARVNND